jgi:hypothetical protein
MNRTALTGFAIAAALAACGGSQSSSDTAGKPQLQPEPPPTAPPPEPQVPFEALVFSKADIPPTLDIPGTVLGGIRWKDVDGDHRIVLSEERTDSSLHLVARRITADGTSRELARDSAEDCEFDLVTSHFPGSYTAKDIDGDQRGEAAFAWALSCTSDVSPLDMYLYVVDGDQVYRATGHSRVQVGADQFAGGEMQADSIAGAPDAVKSHADTLWKQLNLP